MKVIYTFAYLAEDTVDLGTAHPLRHDDTKEVIRCILHNLHRWSKDAQDVKDGKYLIVMATVADDVNGFDDVRMLESGTDTKLGGDLFLVLLFGLTGSFGSKLFDGKDVAVVFSLDQPDSTASTRSKDSTPFAILLCEVCLCGL